MRRPAGDQKRHSSKIGAYFNIQPFSAARKKIGNSGVRKFYAILFHSIVLIRQDNFLIMRRHHIKSSIDICSRPSHPRRTSKADQSPHEDLDLAASPSRWPRQAGQPVLAIAVANPQNEVRAAFQDEARFLGEEGTITRGPGAAGSTTACGMADGIQFALRAGGRLRRHGAMPALILPALDTEVVVLFLEQFSRQLPAGVHAVPVWGRAGLPERFGTLAVPIHASQIPLPGCSPDLNPVEDLWHVLRDASPVEPPVPGL